MSSRWSFGAAFAALRSDGRVISWGLPHAGGDSSAMATMCFIFVLFLFYYYYHYYIMFYVLLIYFTVLYSILYTCRCFIVWNLYIYIYYRFILMSDIRDMILYLYFV